MSTTPASSQEKAKTIGDYRSVLPTHRDLYYGGAWHKPEGGYRPTLNPATAESLGDCAEADKMDVDRAVRAAHEGFLVWRDIKPLERAAYMRKVAAVIRAHAEELALIDAANCGNPVGEMTRDVINAANQFEFFAGLVTELKGETIPMGPGVVNMTVREPFGVVGRIVAYNHPFMFTAAKAAAPIAAGNAVIMKPPYQAPLSAYRFAELIDGILPPGVLNIITGAGECGPALVAHPMVPRVTLIGAAATGRAISHAAADGLKQVSLELGGKNACVVYPDADIERAIKGAVKGMNFTWCGQSCGSTSRLFLHEDIHDQVLEGVIEAAKHYRPDLPTDPATTMGAIISQQQLDKVNRYIDIAATGGATLKYGGGRPKAAHLANGFFVEPTIFSEVRQEMRIANEEVFGPVLSVLRWKDEATMLKQVNAVEYGLTGAVFTSNLANAHRAAGAIESGFIWVNEASAHYLGVSFGGYKASGMGREESFEELLSFTRSKNIHFAL